MSLRIIYRVDREVALIGLASPPVNALGQPLREQLELAIDRATNNGTVKAIVFYGHELPLSAGADISEFGSQNAYAAPSLPDLLERISTISKPTIAAIDRFAFGGGLELTLACDYRIAAPGAQLGLPEVKLGLLPGAGGTQRLPRLVGAKAALDLMVSGQAISAEDALEIGLIQRMAGTGSLINDAIDWARELIETGLDAATLPILSKPEAELDPEFFSDYRRANFHKWRGQEAPDRIVQAVEAACSLSLQDGLAQEMKLFHEAEKSQQSIALRHVFFAEREVTKQPGIDERTALRPVASVAVVGAGTMGGGIAMCFANAGIPVKLLELKPDALERGLQLIRANYDISVKRGKLTQEQLEQRLALIEGTLEYSDLREVDMVIEAVFEKLEIKKDVFRTLDEVCKAGAILATNTSTLDVDQIAAVTHRADEVVGLHFFSPANVMRLLEVVRGKKTAPDVLATTLQVAKRIKKLPVVSGVCFGFIGNRMMEPYSRESLRLLLEGATPAQIDKVVTDFGMAMGILATHDLAGIDVTYLIREERREAIAHDPLYCKIGDELYNLGRLGQKNGRGYYIYEGRDRKDDPQVVELARTLAVRHGIEQRTITDQEIHDRCLLSMINEGIQLLDEGIAQRSSDIDLVWINGYGFPAWRGGPLHYAETIGLAHVLQRLEHYRDSLGEYGLKWFQPSQLLKRLAEGGRNKIERN